MRKLFFCLTLVLAGCGFTLRGDYQIPESAKSIYLQSFDKEAQIAKILTRQLTIYDVKVLNFNDVKKASGPVPVIRLLQDKLDRKTLSLFSTGQVAEHELIYTVDYQIIFPGQNQQQHSLELTRNYQDDPNAVLAKSRELELILSELRQQAADRIIRQLSQFK